MYELSFQEKRDEGVGTSKMVVGEQSSPPNLEQKLLFSTIFNVLLAKSIPRHIDYSQKEIRDFGACLCYEKLDITLLTAHPWQRSVPSQYDFINKGEKVLSQHGHSH